MGVPDYTIVSGVDYKHLNQLSWTLPTWKRNKPKTIFGHPWIIFYDREEGKLDEKTIRLIADHPNLTVVPWPPPGVEYGGDNESKWTNRQRHKMLAGHVFVPPVFVKTSHWLKLDTDAIAKGNDDWIDPEWFVDDPVFIGPKWSFTKPGDQMLVLDRWVEENKSNPVMREWAEKPPLNMAPKPGSERLGHKRCCSWCAFFETEFSRRCAVAANTTMGRLQIPVASQDGFLWYMGTRAGRKVLRINVKSLGWAVRCTQNGILELVEKAMT